MAVQRDSSARREEERRGGFLLVRRHEGVIDSAALIGVGKASRNAFSRIQFGRLLIPRPNRNRRGQPVTAPLTAPHSAVQTINDHRLSACLGVHCRAVQ